MINLSNKPYELSESQICEVYEILKSMTIEEKIGQVFCPIGTKFKESEIINFIEKYKPGGIMYRPLHSKEIHEIHSTIQKASKIPMLLAANLESGGNGICLDGTYFSRQMGIAATNKKEYASILGSISGREANAVGVNWSFAPIVDIDYNFLNPITNIRTYGSNIETIINFASMQIEELRKHAVIPCIKHFPGDGVDMRDQHLLSSCNDLTVQSWNESYGKVYKSFIDNGIESIMVGHILLPEYEKELEPTIKDIDILPASLSFNVMQKLLREQLGFNGLVVTDATPMIGYNVAMPRMEAIPTTIQNGCDMILFNKNIDEDYEAMRHGLETGILTLKRLEEAVVRILATKLRQGLFKNNALKFNLEIVGCSEHKRLSYQCASSAITLVKDKQNCIPLDKGKQKRIRIYNLRDRSTGGFQEEGSRKSIKLYLEKYGFTVVEYDYDNLDFKEIFEEGVSEMKDKCDVVIYMANYDTASNNTVRRIEWIKLMAADAPWFIQEIPTIFISLSNPYHLLDVPMMKTYINCYSNTDEVVESLARKLIGIEPFIGSNPIDPYCGKWDIRR